MSGLQVIDINIRSSLVWMGGVSSPMLFFFGSLLTTLNFYGYYGLLQYLYLPCTENLNESTVTDSFNYLWILTLGVSTAVVAYFMYDPVTCGPHFEVESDDLDPAWYEGTPIYLAIGAWLDDVTNPDGTSQYVVLSEVVEAVSIIMTPLVLGAVVLVLSLVLYLLEAKRQGLADQLKAEQDRLKAELELTRKNAELESQLLKVVEEDTS